MTDAVLDLSEFQARPQSFIVRIWREDLVQHVLSREARYCRELLVAALALEGTLKGGELSFFMVAGPTPAVS